MKWIVITGGVGFIGTNLAKRLLHEGNSVIAIDNFITSSRNQSETCDNYRLLTHDITEPLPLEVLPPKEQIKTIYHLACPTGVPNLTRLSEEMLLTCSIGTKNVLELARLHQADVIFTSTSEVYGNPKIFPQSEKYEGNVSSVGVRSPYEEGKRFAEALIMMYVRKYNVNAKIIRVFNTYGPYMSTNDMRVIPRFMQQIKTNQPLTVEGNGRHTRTFCFVDDLIDGIIAIQKYGKSGEVYNLGSDKEIAIYDLAYQLLSLCKTNKGITFVPRFSEDHDRRLPSLKKTYDLGWKLQISLGEGLRRTIEWYGL